MTACMAGRPGRSVPGENPGANLPRVRGGAASGSRPPRSGRPAGDDRPELITRRRRVHLESRGRSGVPAGPNAR